MLVEIEAEKNWKTFHSKQATGSTSINKHIVKFSSSVIQICHRLSLWHACQRRRYKRRC